MRNILKSIVIGSLSSLAMIAACEAKALPPPPCDDASVVLELTDKLSDEMAKQFVEKARNLPNDGVALEFDQDSISRELKRSTTFLKFQEINRNDHEARCLATTGTESSRSLVEVIFGTAKLNGNRLPEATVKQIVDRMVPQQQQQVKSTKDFDYSLVLTDNEYHVSRLRLQSERSSPDEAAHGSLPDCDQPDARAGFIVAWWHKMVTDSKRGSPFPNGLNELDVFYPLGYAILVSVHEVSRDDVVRCTATVHFDKDRARAILKKNIVSSGQAGSPQMVNKSIEGVMAVLPVDDFEATEVEYFISPYSQGNYLTMGGTTDTSKPPVYFHVALGEPGSN